MHSLGHWTDHNAVAVTHIWLASVTGIQRLVTFTQIVFNSFLGR